MNTKQKLTIYPFSVQLSSVVRHSRLLKEYDIVKLVSPVGWGLNGKDAGRADGGNNLGINVSSDFDASLDHCDTVLFADSYYTLDFEKYIYPKIMKAINAGKNIICTIDLEQDKQKELEVLCSQRERCFKYYGFKNCTYITPVFEIIRENLHKINTPVIFVTGLSEKTYKFEIQLSLRESLLGMGYKVSQVGTRSYCEIFGIHSFPEFMYDTTITESKKVVIFNRYIKEIENKEKPDVIIIGIPGGIMEFNDEFTNRFGILAFEVSHAVTPDVSVLSIPYDEYKPESLENLSKSVKYKFGFDINCFNITNNQPDWLAISKGVEISFLTVELNFVDEKLKSFQCINTPVFNILNKDDPHRMADYLIDKLADYGEMQSV